MNTKERGDFGESAVCEWLEKRGVKILCRNYHSKFGEIDIIANDNGCIAFIEVKSRKNAVYGRASEYVTYSKRKKIILTARKYLWDRIDAQIRFDVAEVYYSDEEDGLKINEINYIENAFICE